MRKNVANLRQRIREMFTDDEDFKKLSNDEKVKVIEEKATEYLEQLKVPLIKMAIKRLINDISGKKRVSAKFVESGDLFKLENLHNKTITTIDQETGKRIEIDVISSNNEQMLDYLMSIADKKNTKSTIFDMLMENIDRVKKKIEKEGAQGSFTFQL